ncbi:MAG: cupin domain-containing protein [Vicinamibacterales bacterium]
MSALANAQDGRATIRPEDVPWPSARAGGAGTSGAGGIETVVLKGDPAKAGLYTLMLRIAPNVRIQAHSHRDDRVATVVKGTWLFGYGDRFDESALKALGPGSVYTEPPNVAHFAMTREEVILQITGTGPSSTTYVDPANDPAKR